MIIINKYRYIKDLNLPGTYTEYSTLEEALQAKLDNDNAGEIHKITKELVG